MKKYASVILLLIFVLFSACKQDKQSTSGLLDFLTIADRFKYEDLQEFSMDTLDWSQRENFYTVVDSISFRQIMQDSTEKYTYIPGDMIDGDFFYSKQKNTRGLTEFTVLSQREGSYIAAIIYKIFDKNGKLISSFMVANDGGDAGYYETSHGKFINENTYELTMEDNYLTKNPEKTNTVRQTQILTEIHKDGSTTQKQKVLNIKFEKTNHVYVSDSLERNINTDSLNTDTSKSEKK